MSHHSPTAEKVRDWPTSLELDRKELHFALSFSMASSCHLSVQFSYLFLFGICFVAPVLLVPAEAFIAKQSPLRINCGSDSLASNNLNQVQFSPDQYFEGGEVHTVSSTYAANLTDQPELTTLRAFHNVTQGCYKVPVVYGRYLVRIHCNYGNYDGLNVPPQFDIYLNGIHVDIIGFSVTNGTYDEYVTDLLAFSKNDKFLLCVKSISGVPFLSSLEVLPIESDSYEGKKFGENTILRNAGRVNSGGPAILRDSEDGQHRTWSKDFQTTNVSVEKQDISIGNAGQMGAPDHLPMRMFQTAREANENSTGYRLDATTVSPFSSWFARWHFAELKADVQSGERVFNIIIVSKDGTGGGKAQVVAENFDILSVARVPFNATTVSATIDVTGQTFVTLLFGVVMSPGSKYQPVLNGFELYEAVEFNKPSKFPIWGVVLVSIGSVLALSLCIILAICCCRKKNFPKPSFFQGEGFQGHRIRSVDEDGDPLRTSRYHQSNAENFENVELGNR